MFGRRRYYVVEDRDSGNGCLIALVIIIGIIAALLYFAWYIILIILGITFFIGSIIGIFHSVKNNIVAYRDSFNSNRYITNNRSSKVLNVLSKVYGICSNHMSYAWKNNATSIKNEYAMSKSFRFFSFNKWLHLFASMFIALWGLLISGIVLLIYFVILTFLMYISVFATIIICLIPVAVSIPLALIQFIKNLISVIEVVVKNDRRYYNMPVYIISKGYKHIMPIMKSTFVKNIEDTKNKFFECRNYKWLSFQRWILLCTGVLLTVIGTLLQVPVTLLHIIAITLGILIYILGVGVFFVIDFIIGLIGSKSIVCPNANCNTKVKRNIYLCDCGKNHQKLTPSIYGIFKKKCSCGRNISCNSISGKFKIKYLCPNCGSIISR